MAFPAPRPMRRLATLCLVTLVGCAGIATAAEPAGATPDRNGLQLIDRTLVLARTVHPRIAYRGPAPAENPARVEVTVFPGGAMSGSLGGIGGQALGDGELAITAPMEPIHRLVGPGGPLAGFGAAMSVGPGATGSSTGAPVGAAASSVGGSVLKATSGLGTAITQAVMGATKVGGGP